MTHTFQKVLTADADLLGGTARWMAAVRTAETQRADALVRAWLAALPEGRGRAAAFETRVWWSPGSAAKAILERLAQKGYQPAAKPQRFIVQGRYRPLRAGEVERAKSWGAELARPHRSVTP